MTFLCFLGLLTASLMALHMGPIMLFKAYNIALNTLKNTGESQEITFYCAMQFTGKMNCLHGDDERHRAF